MTPAQARHLHNLLDPDPDFINTCAAYYCRRNGWSEWLWLMSDGTEATQTEVHAMQKPLPPERCIKHSIKEQITQAGHDALIAS